MSDLTVYAEALIASTARAFYDDEAVALIDVLLRDKFLRDDDMAPRLNMPAKRLRQTLQFLQEEHLVQMETVDDLAQGGSQATKFYYLDYCRAVHSIRLRLHLLRKQLEQAELRARSSSFYLCPGYKLKRCNGRYTEEEAQQRLDLTTGLFLCQECVRRYENDPNAPKLETYTLQLVDNTKELKEAVDNLRRVVVQLSAKFIGNHQLRPGIYDLCEKVRPKKGTAKKQPITSNLPSENFALGIGSKRLAGTGRTAGIKAKKLEQAGVAQSALAAKDYLVSTSGAIRGADGNNNNHQDLIFLKNAVGHEILFSVERGGGARAQLLATKKRRLRKVLDTAASRVGVTLPLPVRVQEQAERKRRLQQLLEEEEKASSNKSSDANKKKRGLNFLLDNIGRHGLDISANHPERRKHAHKISDDECDLELGGGNSDHGDTDDNNGEMSSDHEIILYDEAAELQQLTEENRIASFQAQYRLEVDRQVKLVGPVFELLESPTNVKSVDEEDADVVWEDGDGF